MPQWLDRWLHNAPDGRGLRLSDSEQAGKCKSDVDGKDVAKVSHDRVPGAISLWAPEKKCYGTYRSFRCGIGTKKAGTFSAFQESQ